MAPPQLIFGTANVGSVWTAPEDLDAPSQATARWRHSAFRYSSTLSSNLPRSFATNILAFTADGSGEMTPDAIEKSAKESLEALRIEKINVLYSHRPDPSTPLATQLKGVDAQFKLGRFKEFGVSNWPQASIASFIELAEESCAVKPTAAQYQYNLLARHAEKEFIPFLRRHGIHSSWREGDPFAAGYRRWYIQPGMLAAVERLTALCAEYSLPLPEAAMRWLAHHSALDETDAILIGAKNVVQVEDTVRAVAAGPLPAGLVEGMNSVFDLCKDDAQSTVTF
ncbi:Aldehyde reductase [Mycena venus]|uniref:Aldehyde reductase n=1 Tax=Mycena venus TaxID=2733690 RepID=A0A8H6YUD3_9AGAR|nr:Aldehyde reductase [Mycena venus]